MAIHLSLAIHKLYYMLSHYNSAQALYSSIVTSIMQLESVDDMKEK